MTFEQVGVRDSVRAFLASYGKPIPLTTRELVLATQDSTATPEQRQKVYKALMHLAVRDLADCCTRGEPRPRGRKGEGPVVRPWLWHAPAEPHFEAIMPPTCPHCGGAL